MSQLKAIVDPLLSKVSSAYIPSGYVSEKILPALPAATQTGLLAKYGNQHLRIESSLKGGRGKYKRVESITRSTTSFKIEGHGLEGMVTAEDYKNVLEPYKAEEDEVMGVTTMLWLEKEKALADSLTSTSVLTQNTTLSGTSQFNDYTNSTPIQAFATARETIRAGCGLPPDTIIMDWAVWNKLRFHPQILDSLGFKYNRTGGLNENEFAAAVGVQNVLIAQAVYNSAKEGQSDSLSAVWGKHIVFGVCPTKAQPYQVSLGYLMQYEGQQPRKVYKQENFNPPGSTSILVEDNYQMLISTVGAGYLIKDAIA